MTLILITTRAGFHNHAPKRGESNSRGVQSTPLKIYIEPEVSPQKVTPLQVMVDRFP